MKIIIILLYFVFASHASFAQPEKLQAMEQELASVQKTAKRMWLNIHNFDGDSYLQQIDSISTLCRQFDEMLNRLLIEDGNMTYPFTKLLQKSEYQELLNTHAVWSADSLLRVFSWELPGGTMHFYGNAIQYKNENSMARSFSFPNSYNGDRDVENTGYGYDTVYTLKYSGKTVYILSASTAGSTRVVSCQLIAFSVRDSCDIENIFEDNNRNVSNELNIGYDITCSNLDTGKFPCPMIDEKTKSLQLPEVNNDCFTGNTKSYTLDKKTFKFKIYQNTEKY